MCMSISVCVCLSVCVSVCVGVSVSGFVYASLSVCVYLSQYMCVCQCVFLKDPRKKSVSFKPNGSQEFYLLGEKVARQKKDISLYNCR